MLFFCVILTLFDILSAQNQSPCPEVFQYSFGSSSGSVSGNVRAPVHTIENDLTIKLSIGARLSPGFVGKIEGVEKTWEKGCYSIGQGYLNYIIHFPVSQPLPLIQEIKINNKIICAGPPATALSITTVNLMFKSSFPNCPVLRYKPPTSTNVVQSISPSVSENSVFNPPACGVVGAVATIVKGKDSPRGAFPWHVALFRNEMFICGASLVSSKYVISAAHCIETPGNPHEYMTFLGKHDLTIHDEPGSMKRDVMAVVNHPDYRADNLQLGDADIAMITITTVKFTSFIRPICLMLENVDMKKFSGRKGAIAGWGKDESGKTTHDIKYTQVEVVPQDECKSSHFEYNDINRSFCAGGNNTGPCSGDSGGGLYFKIVKKWHLRGIVSTSIKDGFDNSGCDTANYALYTDVLDFIDWILSFK